MVNPFTAPEAQPHNPYAPQSGPPVLTFGTAFDIGRALTNSWATVKAFAGPLWVGGLLMLIFESNGWDSTDSSSFDFSNVDLSMLKDVLGDGSAMITVTVVFVFLLLGFAFIRTGFIRQCATVLNGADGGLGALFSGVDRMGAMLVLTILQFVIMGAFGMVVAGPAVAVGMSTDVQTGLAVAGLLGLVMVVPFLYVLVGLMLADFSVALEGTSAIDAMKRSWELTAGNRVQLGLFAVLLWLVQVGAGLVGLLMLCVGALATIPLARSLAGVSYVESFLLLTRGDTAWSNDG